MRLCFLLVDLLCPLLFFAIGFAKKGTVGRLLIRESALVLTAALLFAPVSYLFFPIEVQGTICAVLLLIQFLLLMRGAYRRTS